MRHLPRSVRKYSRVLEHTIQRIEVQRVGVKAEPGVKREPGVKAEPGYPKRGPRW